MHDAVEITKDEWRELGFYYEFDKDRQKWLIFGSREGLLNFVRILREYSGNSRNSTLGEHEHYGPYMYLTFITAESPQITDYGIFGSLFDFERLADLLTKSIEEFNSGEVFQIDTEYSNENEAVLFFEVKDESYDPSDADDFAWAKK